MGHKKNRGKTVSSSLKNFSSSQPAGKPVQGCSSGKPVPPKPCNLAMLSFTEPKAQMGETEGARSFQMRAGQDLKRRQDPVLLPPGGTFQIIASSTANPPNQVKVKVQTEAVCSAATHPLLSSSGPPEATSKVAKNQTLGFNRSPMPGDDGGVGLWALLNAVFGQSPDTCGVTAESCGLPANPGGGSVESLNANIQIFPADQYEFELQVPGLLKPDSLQVDSSSSGWSSDDDGQEDEDDYYQSYQNFSTNSTLPAVTQFAQDMENKETGADDEDYVDEIEVKLTQTDGVRELEAPIDDIIKLIRMIRSAEYAMKQLQDWMDDLQVGPGFSFTVDCQFFAGTFQASWGYTEYSDDRAFLQYSGSLSLDIVRASIEFSIGFKLLGMADLLLVLKGEGSISISVPFIEKTSPDEEPKRGEIEPEGELTLSGTIEGTLFWFIKGSVGIETTFNAETDNLSVLTGDAILSGEITISRDPVYVKGTAMCRLLGSDSEQVEIIKGNPQVAVFTFPPE